MSPDLVSKEPEVSSYLSDALERRTKGPDTEILRAYRTHGEIDHPSLLLSAALGGRSASVEKLLKLGFPADERVTLVINDEIGVSYKGNYHWVDLPVWVVFALECLLAGPGGIDDSHYQILQQLLSAGACVEGGFRIGIEEVRESGGPENRTWILKGGWKIVAHASWARVVKLLAECLPEGVTFVTDGKAVRMDVSQLSADQKWLLLFLQWGNVKLNMRPILASEVRIF
jgi:hypothetical protein